ncbi:outer membrane lipoprotein carrier protein LolA [Dyella lutea]|uniref:Outer membrane lipoprotein carrier protein LolA n=1 Tax=Dyella lutea TaxID=2950441 RepID=A0ABT1FBB5_9GAMM|nr:outer membrane lipoprotein carrier protein LolA [Dyella lutea]MCP1374666.1 outer membrane lipoprotein carrier protein LolA [Dyella lutea]
MRHLIALLFALGVLLGTPDIGLCATGTPSPLLQQVLGELARHEAVRADFVQTRSNPALARPQESHGQLLFVLGHGMLWQSLTPVAETLAFTGKQAARIDTRGQAYPLRNARGVAQISGMLQAMLGGRSDEVSRQFTITASGSAAHWTLQLVPRQERVAQVLERVELSGDDFLQGIRIVMHDGGDTDIRFSRNRDAGTLSALEKHVLGLP